MSTDHLDQTILRELTKQYIEVAQLPIQEERRRLWTDHLSLRPTRPPVLATFGMWNVWCREVFADSTLCCADPFYRHYERDLRMRLFQHEVGDDFIAEPWLTVRAAVAGPWRGLWGVTEGAHGSGVEGGAWRYDPPLRDWADLDRLTAPAHNIDEAATAASVQRLGEAVGDLIAINVDRTPAASNFMADISTSLAGLRGLEQVMVDMYESPAQLHRLLAFMRDGILANQQAAEAAGDWSLTSASNQSMTYADGLEPPRPNSGAKTRSSLWGFCAAQEFTLISPAMHDEFLYQYQMPIMAHFGLVHYGCCEDLTRKIDMLRQLPNLRSIAVAPLANVGRCAEQIGSDYVSAWRPNPTDMVSSAWDEGRIRRILREGLAAFRGLPMHLHLKDVETVQGEPARLARWVRIVREECGE